MAYFPDHLHRILIIGGSGSSKTNELNKTLRRDIYKIYLFLKDPFESKYQLYINGRQKVGIKKFKNPKAFIDYSQAIDDVYENSVDYNPTKKRTVSNEKDNVFDDMKANMKSNKKLSPIITELFLKGKKTEHFRLNATHYFIIKIHNKRGLQLIPSNPLSDIDFKDL